jgi:hypothetical protein
MVARSFFAEIAQAKESHVASCAPARSFSSGSRGGAGTDGTQGPTASAIMHAVPVGSAGRRGRASGGSGSCPTPCDLEDLLHPIVIRFSPRRSGATAPRTPR